MLFFLLGFFVLEFLSQKIQLNFALALFYPRYQIWGLGLMMLDASEKMLCTRHKMYIVHQCLYLNALTFNMYKEFQSIHESTVHGLRYTVYNM